MTEKSKRVIVKNNNEPDREFNNIIINCISIIFRGECKTNWNEQERCRGNSIIKSNSVPYSGHEEYFNVRRHLFGGPNDSAVTLNIGLHTYPFSFAIPSNAPSSYEGKKGYVRYTVKVILDLPWKFDQTVKRTFTVISPLDLNANPRLRIPKSITLEKSYKWFLCNLGYLRCMITIPHIGFVPGQQIPFKCHIENSSRKRLKGIKLKLYQRVFYHSTLPKSHTHTNLAVVSEWFLDCEPFSSSRSSSVTESFTVPPLPPSHLTNCRLIDIQYGIQVKLKIRGNNKSLLGQLEVVDIGTIPLVDGSSISPSVESNMTYQQQQQQSFGWNPTVCPYPIPVPTYEESQFGTNNILDRSDQEGTPFNSNYRYYPMYPVYNFPVMPSPANVPAYPAPTHRPSAPLVSE